MSELFEIPENTEEAERDGSELGGATVYEHIAESSRRLRNISKESVLNSTILLVVILLLLGVIATYFVKDLPETIINLRNMSEQALWVFAGIYIIGELLKVVFINRARESLAYKDAKKRARAALKKLEDKKYSSRVKEYCRHYEDALFKQKRCVVLAKGNIKLETFESKYVALSTREIKKRYPEDNLSKAQYVAIAKANTVKREIYAPEFLTSTITMNRRCTPSAQFNAPLRNRINSASALLIGLASSFAAINFGEGLEFAFSSSIVVSVIVRLVVLIFGIALKIIFATSLVFDTEIPRFELQILEVNECIAYAESTPVKTENLHLNAKKEEV